MSRLVKVVKVETVTIEFTIQEVEFIQRMLEHRHPMMPDGCRGIIPFEDYGALIVELRKATEETLA